MNASGGNQVSQEVAVQLSRQMDSVGALLHRVAVATEQQTVFNITDLAKRWRLSARGVRDLLREHGAKHVPGGRGTRVGIDEVLRVEAAMNE